MKPRLVIIPVEFHAEVVDLAQRLAGREDDGLESLAERAGEA